MKKRHVKMARSWARTAPAFNTTNEFFACAKWYRAASTRKHKGLTLRKLRCYLRMCNEI